MIDLDARLRRRLTALETCSHAMCSLSDEAAEYAEANSIRKLLCPHERWQVFECVDTPDKGRVCAWVASPRVNRPGGCYCKYCGISANEAEVG